MKTFDYAAPATIDDAVKLLGTPSAAALSGGTDLISRMKDYVTSPDRVVYLKDIKSIAGISGDGKGGGLTIGANTRLTDIVGTRRFARHILRSGRRPSKWARRRSATWPPWVAICFSVPGAGISGLGTGFWPCKTARASLAPAIIVITRSS